MFVRCPMRMTFTSPRMTTFIQTLLSAPISTSPMTCADWSTNADAWTTGKRPLYGRSIRLFFHSRILNPQLLEVRLEARRVVVELLQLRPVALHYRLVQLDRRCVALAQQRLILLVRRLLSEVVVGVLH